jgi:hypothetical protein
MNIPFNRARRTLSGTQHFIVGTRDWMNRFKKDSNQSLTSLTCETDDIYVHKFNMHLKNEREQKKQSSCENNTALLMPALTFNH